MTLHGFPAGFAWGAATAAYQIEGAVNDDGRGESIWDRFTHEPGRTRAGETGDIACDHYHRYRDDVALVAELGLDAYRFSVSWPRVLPAGTGKVNAAGLDFYDRLVDELREHGIVPHVTLYHWDLPQALEDAGGWPERRTAEAFAAYAALIAARLGDRVGAIATLNEPWCSSYLGYHAGVHAPGRKEPAAALAAAHHLLVGHGLAIQSMRAESPTADLGIVLNFESKRPASTHPLDLEAAAAEHDRYNRWFLDPIVGRGYPEAEVQVLDWGRAEVRPDDMALIATPIDFLGINYYTTRSIRSPQLPPIDDTPSVDTTDMGWTVEPRGLTEVLEFVRSRTGELPLYITENGAAYDRDPVDPTRDPKRVEYLRRHVEAARDAIEHGVPLKGYFAWSLMDNLEWHSGYGPRFGLIDVDFVTQERRIRDSGRYWASLAAATRAAGDETPSFEPAGAGSATAASNGSGAGIGSARER